MQAFGLQRPRQLDRVRRAADVRRGVLLGRRGHVVDRGEVEEVLDLAPQLRGLLGLHAQERPAQVADHRLHTLRGRDPEQRAPALDQVIEPARRARAHEHVHLALALLEQ